MNFKGCVVAFVVAAWCVPGHATPPRFKEGQVNVKFAAGNPLASVIISTSLGARIAASDTIIGWYTLQLPAGLTTMQAVGRLKAMREVKYAEPNFYRREFFNPN